MCYPEIPVEISFILHWQLVMETSILHSMPETYSVNYLPYINIKNKLALKVQEAVMKALVLLILFFTSNCKQKCQRF